jgi:hypothetical protein
MPPSPALARCLGSNPNHCSFSILLRQNQREYDSLERPFRRGATHKDARGSRGLESVGRRASRAIVSMGGALGKTKKVSEHGIEDINNLMSAYTVVRAETHDAAG